MQADYRKRIRNTIKIFSVCFLMLVFMLPAVPYAAGDTGVLVVSEKARISDISLQDLRRLFLGLPADKKSGIQQPVINEADAACYQSFLKNIMYLTENGYKRKLVKRVFRQGADNITSYDSLTELKQHLKDNPGDVSFMYKKNINQKDGLKVVRVLWRD